MNHPGKLVLLVALLAASAQGQDAAAPSWLDGVTVTASGTASWVENLSRTSHEPARKDADTYELFLSASHHRQLAPDWQLHASAEATLLGVPDYDLNNQARLGPRIVLQRKFGLGPLAPVLSLDTAFTYRAARLDAERGWTSEATLRLAKRFTSSFQAGLNGHWLDHAAASETFDLRQREFSIDATWDLNERWSLRGSAGWLSGDIVANASWPIWGMAIYGGFGPVVADYYNSRPWEVTHLFGPGWVSYNVEADVDLWSLAVTYSLSDHTSVELSYDSAFVVNQIDIRYPTDSWGLSVVHRF